MPNHAPLPHAHERLIIAKLFHTILVEGQREYFPDRRNGETLTTLLVFGAVAIGHVEGRPMSASKLAGYLSIPRTTILRNLRALMRRSLVHKLGHIYCVNPDALKTPARSRAPLRNKRLIINAAKQLLSETDTVR